LVRLIALVGEFCSFFGEKYLAIPTVPPGVEDFPGVDDTDVLLDFAGVALLFAG
jgi:hypothetical protein